MRNPLNRLARADRPRVPLRERLAELKVSAKHVLRRQRVEDEANQDRRLVMAGAVAAALPLPALAAPAALPGSHRDAALLAAGARFERAIAAEKAAHAAWAAAWEPMHAVLVTCPPELMVQWPDRRLILGGQRWPTLVGGYLRAIPLEEGVLQEAWTGEVLRNAIGQAVQRLGRGGQTPHHIRRWKAMLPAADAFDAKVQAVNAASNYRAKAKARDAAWQEAWDALSDVRGFTPTTPEGLAFLIRVCAIDQARGCHISPNLLHGAANVVGLDLKAAQAPRPGLFR